MNSEEEENIESGQEEEKSQEVEDEENQEEGEEEENSKAEISEGDDENNESNNESPAKEEEEQEESSPVEEKKEAEKKGKKKPEKTKKKPEKKEKKNNKTKNEKTNKKIQEKKERIPVPSKPLVNLYSVSKDIVKMAENVNDFIESLNSSLNNRTSRILMADKTMKIPNRPEFFNETQHFYRSKSRERSPNFQEKQVDTQELEVYRQMFDKPKTAIYYEKETDTRDLNEDVRNYMQKNKKPIKLNDCEQQTDFVDNKDESSPVFNRSFNKNGGNYQNQAHNIKDLYKTKNKYVYDEKEFIDTGKEQFTQKLRKDNDVYSRFERGKEPIINSSPYKFPGSGKFIKEDEIGIDYAKKLLMKKN